jgi:NAD(P)-dependent dehydrogenase (short-subunit alcohol dehydrogenase family)
MLITESQIVPPPPKLAQLSPDGVYLIAGGLGGLGKAIIRWMGDHGARHIMTLSRSGKADEAAVGLIEEMRGRGISVIIKSCDISSIDEVKKLVAEIEQDPVLSPVRGLIQSAMVVKVRYIMARMSEIVTD